MSGVRIEGALDPITAWDGARQIDERAIPLPVDGLTYLRGAAAWVVGDDTSGWQIVRDPLGINKLFWVRDVADDTTVFAARPQRLVELGHRFEEVHAIPAGAVVDIHPHVGGSPSERSVVPDEWFSSSPASGDPETIGRMIETALTRYLAALASSELARQSFVCVSGGLDSSGIAALACEAMSDPVAVSFDLKRPARGASEDRVAGARVAKDLRMPMVEVSTTEDDLLDRLDSVLVDGADWRDFNVHAALVNAALADGIAGVADRPIVLTGDLANEFLVDYEPETYRGVQHYRLPRLRPVALRTSLVRGLDTCNREMGIFASRGHRLVQPYAVAVDHYLSLDESFLRRAGRKQELSRIVFGRRIPEFVYARTKVRAQVGSATGGGVLGVCLDHGIDQRWLRRRFCQLHQIEDESELDRFIRAGRYRSGIPEVAR